MDNEVTVFRSADPTAQEDAGTIQDMLIDEGIQAKVLDDRAAGVPSGAWEVRVAAADSARAEALIAEDTIGDQIGAINDSPNLDLVPVFRFASEMEAQQVKSLLESNGLEAVMVGDTRLPNLPGEIRVAREHVTQAKRLIAQALAAGPAAADEAEAAGET
jgi:hypothetical protein